jgi:RNA polymerase sigma-70 factor, ECF subfamily
MPDGAGEPLRTALADVYDRHGAAMFRVAWTLLRSRPDAEDAVQEVFVGLAHNPATLARIENLRAYLYSALRHAAGRIAARRTSETLADEPPAREAATVDDETSALLERALAALPIEQREVVTLKIDGRLTFAEIAAVLGVRLKTAASRYRYALEKLRATFDEARHEPRTAPSRPA